MMQCIDISRGRDGRTSVASKNSLALNCETIQCLAGRGSVGGGYLINGSKVTMTDAQLSWHVAAVI